MSKKDQIDANKEMFLNEISQQEDELMDEVAGGYVEPDNNCTNGSQCNCSAQ